MTDTAVTLTVSDGLDMQTCVAKVRALDCEPPQVTCPPAAEIECTQTEDGFLHIPPPPPATAVDACSTPVVMAPDVSSVEPMAGNLDLVYSATDASGNVGGCTWAVTVVDTRPPRVTVPPEGAGELWPPDGTFHNVTLADCGVQIDDDCTGGLGYEKITCVTSDENGEDDEGQPGCLHDPAADIVIVDLQTVSLRAARNGRGDGRVYTIGFEITDLAGNTTPSRCRVTVPRHSGGTAIDSGPHETVCNQELGAAQSPSIRASREVVLPK
jgi:hypothetical protein